MERATSLPQCNARPVLALHTATARLYTDPCLSFHVQTVSHSLPRSPMRGQYRRTVSTDLASSIFVVLFLCSKPTPQSPKLRSFRERHQDRTHKSWKARLNMNSFIPFSTANLQLMIVLGPAAMEAEKETADGRNCLTRSGVGSPDTRRGDIRRLRTPM